MNQRPQVTKLFLFIFLFFASSSAFAHDGVESAQKEVIKISAKGASPTTIHFTKEDGSVFFLNNSKDSLMTLDIDFKGRRAHCASTNMKFSSDGHLRSTTPVGPKDFAITCFPEKGTYEFLAYGILGNQKPISGSIIVE